MPLDIFLKFWEPLDLFVTPSYVVVSF